ANLAFRDLPRRFRKRMAQPVFAASLLKTSVARKLLSTPLPTEGCSCLIDLAGSSTWCKARQTMKERKSEDLAALVLNGLGETRNAEPSRVPPRFRPGSRVQRKAGELRASA